MADSGNYTCDFPNNYPSPTFHIELVVGAAPEPSVTILDQTDDWARLQCEANGVPDLEVHWQDSDGNKLPAEEPQVTERGGRKYITLNTTVTKTGNFYCVATQENLRHTISAEIYVSLPERVVVKQDDDAVLNCSINGVNIENALFDWKKDGQNEVFLYDAGSHYNNGRPGQDEKFKGRVSHFQDELKHGNASILITNTKVSDSGNYTCIFPFLQPPQWFHVELVVGVVPKPSITTMDETETSALLQCEADVVPDLEVHWQDSDGNKLTAEEPQVTERGRRKYITLNTTVTKTGRFYCVATQKKISHSIFAETYVRLTGIVVVKKGRAVVLPCSPNFNTESQMFHWKKDGQKEVFVYDAGLQSDGQDEQFKGRVSHFQDELKHGNASIKITNTKVDDSGNYTCEFPNLHPSPTFKIELVVVGEDKPQTPLSAVIRLVVCTIFGILLVVAVVHVLYKRYTKLKHDRDEKQPEESPMNQQNSETA